MPTASRKPGRRHCGWVGSDDGSDIYQAGSRNLAAAPPVPAALEPAELTLHPCEGHHVLHISDLEMPEELASELIPSDHPRASTIFLKKSQMDVQGKRKKNFSYDVSKQLKSYAFDKLRKDGRHNCIEKTIHSDSDFNPDSYALELCCTLQSPESFKNNPKSYPTPLKSDHLKVEARQLDADRSKDIFDERLHPFTQERVPEEHFSCDPDPDSIYRFISPFFSATQLRAEYAITTLPSENVCKFFRAKKQHASFLSPDQYGKAFRVNEEHEPYSCTNGTLKSEPQGHKRDTTSSLLSQTQNEMERHFLDLLEFRLNISASVYAKYYFDLRSLARDHGLPIVFAPLQKERAQNLEAISRYCKNKNPCRVTIKKSSSADNVTNMQHANVILS
ncbi:cyclin-Y-like protein 1 [Glossophaga mutica]